MKTKRLYLMAFVLLIFVSLPALVAGRPARIPPGDPTSPGTLPGTIPEPTPPTLKRVYLPLIRG